MSSLQDLSPNLKCADCALRRQGICGQLSALTQARLARIATIQICREDQSVWDSELDCGLEGVLISGSLRIQSYRIGGQRQISGLMLPGDFVSEPCGRRNACQLEASAPVRFCRFERNRFRRLLECAPDLARAVYVLRVIKLEQLRLLAWSLCALSIDERFCAFLAMITRVMPYAPLPGGGGILTVELKRADIADLLGTSQESISRITHRLAVRGVIRIHDPQHFEIPDLPKLVQMGCMQDSFASILFAQSAIRQPPSSDRALGAVAATPPQVTPTPAATRPAFRRAALFAPR
jgi:CRP/FNR family transcriptional regulator